MKKVIFIFFIGICFYSCNKNDDVLPTKADIIGHITFDQQYSFQNDFTGIEINVYDKDDQLVATVDDVDENGKYIISQIQFGSYDIIYSKDNYVNDTISLFHMGGPEPTIQDVVLYPLSQN